MLDVLLIRLFKYPAGIAKAHAKFALKMMDLGSHQEDSAYISAFSRLTQNQEINSSGIGLGLAVTKSIVTRHNTQISLGQSKLNGRDSILVFQPIKVSFKAGK